MNFSDLGTALTPGNSGSGTHTATMYPMVSAYGSLMTAESNGRYSYIQGVGSLASDSTILCQMNMVYWCRTGLLPPYALSTYSPANNPSFDYFPGTCGPVARNLGQPGERQDIAQIDSWCARHAFTQATVDEQVVRVIGLAGCHLPVALYDSTTRSIPVANNGTYSGMPTADSSFRWYASSSNYGGFTPPSNVNVYTQGWSPISSDHMNAWAYYPYLFFGEPHLKELLALYGNLGFYQGYPNSGTAVVNGSINSIGFIRNGTINGVTRAGIFFGEDGIRSVAWAFRDIGSTGIANYENASWNTYFDDIVSDTLDGMADYRAMLAASAASYVTANGLWQEAVNNLSDMWTLGYFIGALNLVAGIRESTAADTFIEYLNKWPAHISNTFSPWLVAYYRATVRQAAAENSLYIASDASLGMYNWHLSWSLSGSLFTFVDGPVGYILNNGDVFVWNGPGAGGDGSTPPAGMSGWTGYFVINKSGSGAGSTFQLSTTLGGSAITLSDSSGSSGPIYGRPSSPPSTGSIDSITGSGYVANITSASNWSNARGIPVDATYLAAITARLTGTAGYVAAFNDDPKYATQATYQ